MLRSLASPAWRPAALARSRGGIGATMNRVMAIGLVLSGLLHAALFTAVTWQGPGAVHQPRAVREIRLQFPTWSPVAQPLPVAQAPQAVDAVAGASEPVPVQEKQGSVAPALVATKVVEPDGPPRRIAEQPAELPPRPAARRRPAPSAELRRPVAKSRVSDQSSPASKAPAITPAAVSATVLPPVITQPVAEMQIQTHYLAAVVSRIQRNKYYPRKARRRGEEGQVVVSFVIRKDGALEGIAVSVSSGHRRLDEAALKTLRRASPLPPIPDALRRDRWAISVPIAFSLRG